MYAIYRPLDSTVRAAGVIRDITRLILERSTANLQFHDPVRTSIVHLGDPHGWTLAAGQSLSTDATPGVNDQKYVLENNTQIAGKKKYAAICFYGAFNNATVYNGTISATTSGITVSAIIDYGTANEMYACGRTDATVPINVNSITHTPGHNFPANIFIFADANKIILIGSVGNGQSYAYSGITGSMILKGVVEFPDSITTQLYRNVYSNSVPLAQLQWSNNYYGPAIGGDTYGFMNRYKGDNYALQANVQANIAPLHNTNFLKCIYYRHTNEYFRYYALVTRQDTAFSAVYASLENNTQFGGTPTIFSSGTGPSYSTGDRYADGMYTLNPIQRMTNIGSAVYNTFATDLSGNVILPLYPIYYSLSWINAGDIIDLSAYGKIYYTTALTAAAGDTITIGTKKYAYFGSDYNSASSTYKYPFVIELT